MGQNHRRPISDKDGAHRTNGRLAAAYNCASIAAMSTADTWKRSDMHHMPLGNGATEEEPAGSASTRGKQNHVEEERERGRRGGVGGGDARLLAQPPRRRTTYLGHGLLPVLEAVEAAVGRRPLADGREYGVNHLVQLVVRCPAGRQGSTRFETKCAQMHARRARMGETLATRSIKPSQSAQPIQRPLVQRRQQQR